MFASLAWIKVQAALSVALLFIKVANDGVPEREESICVRNEAKQKRHDMNSHGKCDTKQRQSNRLHANPAPPPAAAQTSHRFKETASA